LTEDVVSAWMGDYQQTGKPYEPAEYVTSQLDRLSLLSSVGE